jgi:PAS domain S-box-containing protein
VRAARGGCALVGWVTDVDLLKSVVVGQVTMKANTAICFVASGVALWTLSRRAEGGIARAARALAATVALIAAAVLSQYLTGLDLGIDQLLFQERPGAIGTAHANRMSPNTALAFILVGAALALLDVRVLRRWGLAPGLAGVAAVLALLALLGYVAGVTSLYGVHGYTQMAVPTTVAFLALTLGLCCARPDRPPMRALTRDGSGGIVLRRLAPACVAIPIVLGGLRLAGQHAGLYGTDVGTWLFVIAIIALSLPLAWFLARSVDNAEAHRRQAVVLRESEERTRRILETAYDAFVAMDAQGRIVAWNPAAERMFGWSTAEAVGREMAQTIIPVRLRAKHDHAIGASIGADVDVPGRRAMETFALHRDGHEIPVELTAGAVRDGDAVLFHAFLRDITERRRAHDELQAAQEDALHRLALAAEYRDDDTGQPHATRG